MLSFAEIENTREMVESKFTSSVLDMVDLRSLGDIQVQMLSALLDIWILWNLL